jgi:hypothetical protein
MRLFEVEGNFSDDLEQALRVLIGQNSSDSMSQDKDGSTITLAWPAINNMLKNMNYAPVKDPEQFKKMVDSHPILAKMVKDIQSSGVVITVDEPEDAQTEIPAGPSVDQMAASGAKDFQADLS